MRCPTATQPSIVLFLSFMTRLSTWLLLHVAHAENETGIAMFVWQIGCKEGGHQTFAVNTMHFIMPLICLSTIVIILTCAFRRLFTSLVRVLVLVSLVACLMPIFNVWLKRGSWLSRRVRGRRIPTSTTRPIFLFCHNPMMTKSEYRVVIQAEQFTV